MLFSTMEKPEKALIEINKAIELDSTIFYYYKWRSGIYKRMGKESLAKTDSLKAKQMREADL